MPNANDTQVPVAPTAPTMPTMPPLVAPPAAPVQDVSLMQQQLAAAQAAAAVAGQPVPAAPVAAPAVEAAPAVPTFPTPPVQDVAAVPAQVPPMPPITASPVAAPVAAPPVVAPTAPVAAPVAQAPIQAPVPTIPPAAAIPTTVPAAMPSTATAVLPTPATGLTNLGAQMDQMQSGQGGGLFDRFKQQDLSQVQTNNFRLLPVDVPAYEGRITKFELGTSSTGFPQAKMTVKSYYPSIHAGVSVTTYITLQPNSMWVWKSLLEACGLLGPQGQCLAEGGGDFVGKAVQFQIRHDTYDGAPRNKIAGGFSSPQYTDEVPANQPQIQLPAGAPQPNWG